MKKTIFFILLSFAVSGLIFSQDIQIKEPAPGKTYHTGKTCPVKWTKPKDLHTSVKLTLRNPNQSLNSVITMSTPNNGYYLWNIPLSLKPGEYILRVKTIDNKFSGNSGIFIVKKPGADIGIIQVEQLKTPPVQNIPKHRAPAISQPSNASFFIEKIYYDIKQGKLRNVRIMVRYNSKTAFSFSNYQGHPKDGPVYMNCKITIPDWDAWETGPNPPVVIFNHRLSIKYGGKNSLACDPPILNPGNGHFELILNPDHSGKILGLEIWKDISGAIFTTPKPCKYFYYPKLEVRLFVHTKENVKQAYKRFYLSRTEMQTKKVKGDVDDCHGGQVNW